LNYHCCNKYITVHRGRTTVHRGRTYAYMSLEIDDRTLLIIVEPDKETLARYPFLQDTGAFIRDQRFDFDELSQPGNEGVVLRAKERVIEAIRGMKVSNKTQNIETEILSFPLALLFVRTSGLHFLMSRYSHAEAIRAESLLQSENNDFVRFLFYRITGVKTVQSDSESQWLEIPIKTYLQRSTYFHTPNWKLVNRRLKNGNIYVNKPELVRLVREEIKDLILSRFQSMPSIRLPERFQPIINEIIQITPVPTDAGEEIIVTPDKYPPCLLQALNLLKTGQNVPHYGRFLMAAYLIKTGKSVDEIVQLYQKAPDFSEKITRYQVEHIAGLRGGRERYIIPNCRTLSTHNFCFRTEACGTITTPIQFGRQKPQEKTKNKIAAKNNRVS
jgi:DNA primase large subunit